MAQLKSAPGWISSWETTAKGKSTQRDARSAATHLAPQGVPALWRYDKWSHLPNCLSWLCSALVSGVAENVPGKNSGRFWENFLYGKRLPWADRQVWVPRMYAPGVVRAHGWFASTCPS